MKYVAYKLAIITHFIYKYKINFYSCVRTGSLSLVKILEEIMMWLKDCIIRREK